MAPTPSAVSPVSPARAKLTSRAAVLVLVLAVLVVSYASSLRAYLEQRSHLSQLRAELAESKQTIKTLQREKDRWDDPAYVKAQARERFAYVMPGEIGYQVLDANGKPLGHTDTLSEPPAPSQEKDPLWWQTTLGSIEAAGNPPVAVETPEPATEIRAPKQP